MSGNMIIAVPIAIAISGISPNQTNPTPTAPSKPLYSALAILLLSADR